MHRGSGFPQRSEGMTIGRRTSRRAVVVARIFLSHAAADVALAVELRELLTGGGHEAFLDSDPEHGIRVGEEWKHRLFQALRWADATVCVVTSAYVASPWCAAEVGIAQALGARLLP